MFFEFLTYINNTYVNVETYLLGLFISLILSYSVRRFIVQYEYYKGKINSLEEINESFLFSIFFAAFWPVSVFLAISYFFISFVEYLSALLIKRMVN